jgi:hypothetical protein
MHFHLPKPLHGWREFAGEVGIIVVGVLIALAAEQVVETIHWKDEVAGARRSLDAQLADAKFSSIERVRYQACISRQLDRLDDIVSASDRPKIYQLNLSPIRVWGTSAWESASASGAVAHMSADERNLYAGLFTITGLIGNMNRNEYDLSGEVRLLNRPRTLSEGMRDHLIQDIARLRQLNFILALGSRQWLDEAKPLHLPLPPEDADELRHPRPCGMPDQVPAMGS